MPTPLPSSGTSSVSTRSLYGGHYVGEVIGDKVLSQYAGRNPHRHHLWMWRCGTCGEVRGPSTISHLNRSRMCLACSYQREHNGRWQGHEELTGVWFSQVRYFAIKRGIPWALTIEEAWDRWVGQDGRCIYTGWPLTHGVDASLDRIDNTKGYDRMNIQWTHRDVNRMKSDFTEGRFLELCRAVAS